MRYTVIIEKDSNGYIAKFPDIPEALTCGDTLEETKALALDALITALEFYFEDQRAIPMPSTSTGTSTGEKIQLPFSVWLKVLLLNELLKSSITQAEIARQIGVTRQEMQRITNLKHNTKIDTLYSVFKVLGKELTVSLDRFYP